MNLLNAALKITLLTLFISETAVVSAQKKVEGLPYQNGRLVSEFTGDKFTLIKPDGYTIYNLSGEVVASGIKTIREGFMERPVELRYQVYFDQQSNQSILLKHLSGTPANASKYEKVHRFITDNTAVALPAPVAEHKFAYIDTLGKVIATLDFAAYSKALGADAKNNSSARDGFLLLSSFFSTKDFKPFHEGLTTLLNPVKNQYGFVDTQFKMVIPAVYTQAETFFEGKAAVMNKDGQWGFINKKGEQVIPYAFSNKPSRFSSGLAQVRSKTRKLGYINETNQVIIEPKYEYATDFYQGFALARESYKSPVLLIDVTGKVITTFDPKYSYFNSAADSFSKDETNPYHFPETLVQLVKYGKGVFKGDNGYGLLDKAGNIVLNFDFQELKDYHDGKMIAHQSKFIDGSTQHKYGIIDEKGDFLIEFVDSTF